MILIGSRALALRAPKLLARKPVDFDFVSEYHEADQWIRDNNRIFNRVEGTKLISTDQNPPIEFEIVTSGSSNELLESMVDNSMTTPFGRIPNLDTLFTLKSSHKHKKNSPHFWKTASDYHRMKGAGAKILPELHALREKESYAAQSHPVLMQGKKDFFKDDGIKYQYDHDSIHKAVALQAKPAYQFFAREGEEVFSSKTKFYDQPLEIQLNSVIEESAVLAVERSLVPFPGAMTHKQAWFFALSKVCTSIASGWWRAFAFDNLPAIVKLYPEGYHEKFIQGLAAGVVKECT